MRDTLKLFFSLFFKVFFSSVFVTMQSPLTESFSGKLPPKADQDVAGGQSQRFIDGICERRAPRADSRCKDRKSFGLFYADVDNSK